MAVLILVCVMAAVAMAWTAQDGSGDMRVRIPPHASFHEPGGRDELAIQPSQLDETRIVRVDAGGNADHTTLQAAHDAASADDTLLVYPGTYEGFTPTKNVDVVALGAGVIIEETLSAAGYVIDYTGSDVLFLRFFDLTISAKWSGSTGTAGAIEWSPSSGGLLELHRCLVLTDTVAGASGGNLRGLSADHNNATWRAYLTEFKSRDTQNQLVSDWTIYGNGTTQEARYCWFTHGSNATGLIDAQNSTVDLTECETSTVSMANNGGLIKFFGGSFVGNLTQIVLTDSLANGYREIEFAAQPAISDLTNIGHDHSDAANGGTLPGAPPAAHATTHEALGSDVVGHDDLDGWDFNDHIDWTSSSGTIHTDNYVEGGPGTDTTAIHDNTASEISIVTEKTTLASADLFLLEDSGAANAKKRVTRRNILGQSSKSITVEDPGATEDISIFFSNIAITVVEMRAVVRGSTPSVTWTVRHHATDRSNAGSEVVSSGTTTTSQTAGSDVTSFSDPTIPADSFVWLETTAQTGTVDELHVTIFFTQD
jgi:hypothetical protein